MAAAVLAAQCGKQLRCHVLLLPLEGAPLGLALPLLRPLCALLLTLAVPLRLHPAHLGLQLRQLQHQRLQAAQHYHAGSRLGAAMQIQHEQLPGPQPLLLCPCSAAAAAATAAPRHL